MMNNDTDVDALPARAAAHFDTLDAIAWAMRLCNDLHRLPARSAARHGRLIASVGQRLNADGLAFLFRVDALTRRPDLIRQLAGPPAVAAVDRARLGAWMVVAADAIGTRAVGAPRRTLADVLPIGGDRFAAVVFTRGVTDSPFAADEAGWLSVIHAHVAWLYEAYAAPGRLMLHALAPRERETLGHLLGGASEKQAAAALRCSPHTIHAYVKRIYRTLGVNSRGELLAIFVDAEARRGLELTAPAGPRPRRPDA